MVPVVPMLVPQDIRVEAGNNQSRDHHAIQVSYLRVVDGDIRFPIRNAGVLLDGDLAPEV